MPERDHQRDPLRRLAARLAQDRPVDWDAEERAAPEEDQRAAIRQLRMVAAMAGFYRAVPPVGGSEESQDLSESVSVAKSVAGFGEGAAGFGEGAAGEAGGDGAAQGASAPTLSPGSRWGQLEILERIGRGAFGEVFRARDTRLDREVALKLLTEEATGPSDERVREARLLAKVRHQNVVTVHGADRIDDRAGIWMEFLHGETLDRILRVRGKLDAREAALIGIDLCRALSAVHAAGIIHQDVKLANVMRAQGGRIVLMDFGLGRESVARGRAGRRRSLSGTPLFMAPEVLRGGEPDPRSDVYSLGVVLFALVTGSLPVEASTLPDLLAQHERGAIKHARELRPDLPEDFAHLLDRVLSPDLQARFATPGEVERALLRSLGAAVEAGQTEAPATSRRRARTVALVSAGLLAIAIAFGWREISRRPGHERPVEAPFPDTPTLTLTGEETGDMFGLAVAGVGDVDQDGFDDLLVGAPYGDGSVPDCGKVYLYRGGSAGLDPQPAWIVVGSVANGWLGASIAARTNLSFDGFADLVVSEGGTEAGRILVFPGSKDGPAREPIQVLSVDDRGTLFGGAIATGDVDHDGDDDLLVGEPWFPTRASSSGRALLYLADGGGYSSVPAWIRTGPPGSQFGYTADLGGDVNNDGFRDAVVGATRARFGPEGSESGAAFVYLGTAAGLDTVPTVLPGRQADAVAGLGVLLPGDLDGDGYGDVIVGAEGASNGEDREGVAEIYFGSRLGTKPYGASLLESNNAGANFGSFLGSLGDLDGDGCNEFFVSAVRYQVTAPREGAAFIFRGSRRHDFQRIWFRAGGKAGSWYGACGKSAGDVNGDGLTDLVVAAPAWDSEVGQNVGRVDIFLQRPRR
jgi:serine/threonine-protein kinase